MKGPILIKVFSCKDCEHLKKVNLYIKNPYSCYHKNIIITKNGPQLMLGNIGPDKITPDFCPLLFKKNRVEKLKMLQSYK
jgi:hypothetical protein